MTFTVYMAIGCTECAAGSADNVTARYVNGLHLLFWLQNKVVKSLCYVNSSSISFKRKLF